MKKINGTQYNVDAISQMTFEEFASTCADKTREYQENIYFQITGKKPEVVKKKKDIPVEEKKD